MFDSKLRNLLFRNLPALFSASDSSLSMLWTLQVLVSTSNFDSKLTSDPCVPSGGPWCVPFAVSRFLDTGTFLGFPGLQIFRVGAL